MDLGLELLMNPKKKQYSDSGSGGDNMSVRSIKLADDVSRITSGSEEDDYQDEDEGEGESFIESVRVNEMEDAASIASSHRTPPRRQHHQRFEPSVASESDDTESLGSRLASGDRPRNPQRHRMSDEEILNAKRELLYQFERLEKKGMKLPRKFTMASNLDDMKNEYDRLKRDREIDNSVKFQRKALMMFTSGVELLNSNFDPLGAKLDGWSESIHESIDEYDDVFEELHDKYMGKAKALPPEIKLLMTLSGSAFMFHITNSMFKTMPGIDQVFKQNPGLMKQFAAATANTMQQQQPKGSMFSGLSGMFSNMFGGGGDSGPSQPPPPQQSTRPAPAPAFNMRGPSDVDDIMKELEKDNDNDNDRIEIMSTVTSSEFTELQDDASINNLVYRKKKKSGRSVTLDI